MLLTISTTMQPATDLGYLLHKHPERMHSFELAVGQAHVFYPEASAERCTAALLLDINPVGLVRRASSGGFALEQYVNDRPYVASSFLSVAIANVYRSALNGKSKDRPALVTQPVPLTAQIVALPCRGGEALLRRLFEPLGYQLEATAYPLDPQFPQWGSSEYFTVTLSHTLTLQQLLTHLYVLIPVLDNAKHYFIGQAEIETLLRRGAGWLEQHPEVELITQRYLRHRRSLAAEALAQLTGSPEDDATSSPAPAEEQPTLHQQRLSSVLAVLKDSGARRVLDVGCGEGRLLSMLLQEPQFQQILGMDVASRSLDTAAERLHLEQLAPQQRSRIHLIQGSLMYRDPRLSGFDAAAVVEVIEHLDPPRLSAFERVLFEFSRPALIVLTTPNREYNGQWPTLAAGAMRHKDHRFEWTRAEFAAWGDAIAARMGYQVRYLPVGPEDAVVGAPGQMAIFEVQP